MKYEYLFESGGTEQTSRFFHGGVIVLGFNFSPARYSVDASGALLDFECGDSVSFERLLIDGHYNLDCKGIHELGALASSPVQDDCGQLLRLSHCRNEIALPPNGIYRAIYHGENRPDISVIFQKDKRA